MLLGNLRLTPEIGKSGSRRRGPRGNYEHLYRGHSARCILLLHRRLRLGRRLRRTIADCYARETHKKPRCYAGFKGYCGFMRTTANYRMVEAGGIEPPSQDTPSLELPASPPPC